MIGRDEAIALDLQEEVYNEMEPNQMFDYADRLEEEIETLREKGLITKDSYAQYSREYDESIWLFKDPKMSHAEYAESMHWREQNLRRAIC